jgi:TolA-binding protein
MSGGEKWLTFWAFLFLFFLFVGLSVIMIYPKLSGKNIITAIFKQNEDSETLYRKICESFDLKEYQKALDLSSDFLAEYPESNYRIKVLYLTAEIFYLQKDLNKAKQIIQKIFTDTTAEGPDYIQAVELSGNIAREIGIFDPIINNHLESAYMKADPNEKSRISIYLGYQALFKKDYTESLRYFSESPPDEGIIGRARVYIEKGNYPQAIQEYLNFFNAYPGDERYDRVRTAFIKQSIYYAGLLKTDKDYTKAIQYYLNIVNQFPNDPDASIALLGMAEIYSINKDYKNAVLILNKVLKKQDKSEEEALYQKAIIYYQCNKKNEAIHYFKELQDKYPAGAYGKKAGEWIDLITKDIQSN